MRKTIIFALVLLAAAGCSKTGMPEKGGRAVRLALSLDGIEVMTRTVVKAEPYLSAPSEETPFATDVWFTLTPGYYGHEPDQNPELSIPVHTVVSHTNVNGTDAKYDGKNILYPVADESAGGTAGEPAPVYCVGFYPANSDAQGALNWEQDTDNVVTHRIDGTQDLMFADLIKGSNADNFPPQQFGHVLSWVKINVIATSVEAANAWGKVKYLSIGGKKSTVKVSLTGQSGTPSEISFVRDEDVDQAGNPTDTLCLKTVETENSAEMIDLNIRGTLAGSVFCCPPEAESKKDDDVGYWVTVQTEKGSRKDVFVPISWSGGDDTGIGNLLIINLYFNEVSVVSGVCTLSYWEDTSEDLYLEEVNS